MNEHATRLRLLFVGNSHTFFNDMPEMVAERFRKDGYDCEVAMIAHGGWSLSQLVEEPEVQFNIRYGHYDYVMLQDMSNPFESERRFMRCYRHIGAVGKRSRSETNLVSAVDQMRW